eukprot:5192695-Alexandrium_andersonii.AAC.1
MQMARLWGGGRCRRRQGRAGAPPGDPFSPLALSVVLAPSLRAIDEAVGDRGLQVSYLDDRSGLT